MQQALDKSLVGQSPFVRNFLGCFEVGDRHTDRDGFRGAPNARQSLNSPLFPGLQKERGNDLGMGVPSLRLLPLGFEFWNRDTGHQSSPR